jgi:hypothetical protein
MSGDLTTSANQRLCSAVSKKMNEDFGADSQEMIDQMLARLIDMNWQKCLTQVLQIAAKVVDVPSTN